MQRFTAAATGIIWGRLGKKRLTFRLAHAERAEVDGILFDTCVKLINHEISDHLIRYAFVPEEEAFSASLAKKT